MKYFTLITGIASLLGFLIQVFDLFPRFGALRRSLLLVVLGVFVGSLFRTFDSASIKFDFPISGFSLLVGFLALIALVSVVVAASTVDNQRRLELYGVAGVASLIFCMVLMFGSTMHEIKLPDIEKDRLTITELIALADRALEKKDLDRAKMHLQTIDSRGGVGDQRLSRIREGIKNLEKEEAAQRWQV